MEAGGFREERSGVLLMAALTGLAAAIVGGIVWGLIVRWTDYEIGFAAWGIGFAVGTAVAFGAQGRRGLPFQVTAVVLALLGIILGKYLAFVWIGQDELGKAGLSLPLFSSDTVRLFWDLRSDVWSFWDLLWAGLAVVTAYRIPQHEHAEATEVSAPAGEARLSPNAGASGSAVETAPPALTTDTPDWAARTEPPARTSDDS